MTVLLTTLVILQLASIAIIYKLYLSHNKPDTTFEQIKPILDTHQEQTFNKLLNQQTNLKSDILQTLLQTLKHQHEQAATNHKNLSDVVHTRLKDISMEVNQKLQNGFEKNSEVFQNVIKRLSIIDQAQKKITDLSENVVALQDILTDKSSRGAFGELQLEQLVANILPAKHFKLQAKLPNERRVDCLLLMPQAGHIAIDAKFPLENYQKQHTESESVQKQAFAQFKIDVKKHIDDISERYIIPQYTTAGAMMFIPAEAVFAHIHAHHPDLIAHAHKQKVWITSPTTLMAVLNTALSVIKDYSTREQVDIIKQHLAYLAKDFERFDKRMEQLAKHINQANKDVGLIQQSSTKITKRFVKIESCEISPEDATQLLTEEIIE